MRLTIAILASLLFVANTAVSHATIIVTPVTAASTPGVGVTTQSFTMRLRMTSNASDSVAQYAFNVALSTAAGPISFTNDTRTGTTGVFMTQIATGLGFGGEFSQTNTATTGVNTAFIEGQPGGGSPFTFTNDSLAFNGPTPASGYFRERELTFAVNRPLFGADRDILVNITPATINGSGGLTSFRNAAGGALATNFGTGTTVVGGTISAVPEPTSMALVALVGGIAAGARLRARKGKKKSVALEV